VHAKKPTLTSLCFKKEEKASIGEKYQTDDSANGDVDENLSDCVQEAADSYPIDVISIT